MYNFHKSLAINTNTTTTFNPGLYPAKLSAYHMHKIGLTSWSLCVTVMDEVLSPAMFPATTQKVWVSPGNSPGRVTEMEGTVLTCSRENENGSIYM